MVMSSSPAMMELPRAIDATRDKTSRKQTSEDESGLSFPSMLEQKQTPAQQAPKGEVAEGNTENKLSQSNTSNSLTLAGNDGLIKDEKVELTVVTGSALQSVTSISSFLKSQMLVGTEEKIIATNTPNDPAAATVSGFMGNLTLIPNGIAGTAAGTVAGIAAEAIPGTATENTETPKAIISPLGSTISPTTSALSQELSSDLKQESPSTNETSTNPKTALQSPEGKTTETLVAEKASPIIKDVVLASSKPIASTYSVPGKLASEMAAKKNLDTGSSEVPTANLVEENGPLKIQVENNGELSKDALPVNTPEIASSANETIKGPEAEASTAATAAKSEAPAPTESFNVPMEISTSTSSQTAMKTPGTNQPTISAEIRQQVIEHLASRLEGPVGNEKVTLYLNPERLGQIEVQIMAKNDSLTVVLTVPEGQVEKAVQDSVKDLTESLLARGGRFQQVDVKIESKSTQNEREQQRENASKDKESKDHKGSAQDQDEQQDAREYSWAAASEEG